ncbi:MAG TPA: hypothetical protein VJJ24_01845 [Candidatus Paceibacterota bacterium]
MDTHSPRAIGDTLNKKGNKISQRELTARESLAQVFQKQVTAEVTLRGAQFVGFTAGTDQAIFSVNSGRALVTIDVADIKGFKVCHSPKAAALARAARDANLAGGAPRGKKRAKKKRPGRTSSAPTTSRNEDASSSSATTGAVREFGIEDGTPTPERSHAHGSDPIQRELDALDACGSST